MNKIDRRKFVELNNVNSRFEFKNNTLIYKDNKKVVKQLSILVDFPKEYPFNDYINCKEKPILLKYGEYDQIIPYFNKLSEHPDFFNPKIIEVPLDMFKWIDIVFDISCSNWVYYLIQEISEKYK